MADIEGEGEVESAFGVLQYDLDALRSAILDAEYDSDSLLSQINQLESSVEDLRFAVSLLTSFATRLAWDAELCTYVASSGQEVAAAVADGATSEEAYWAKTEAALRRAYGIQTEDADEEE